MNKLNKLIMIFKNMNIFIYNIHIMCRDIKEYIILIVLLMFIKDIQTKIEGKTYLQPTFNY